MAALVMAPLHAALGLHVIRRGVIFIDLAVAQVAAFGIALAMAQGVHADSPTIYWAAVGSALFGALLISLTRFKLGLIPHEAMIGIVFVLGSAASIIALGYADHGQEQIKTLLDGQILFVQPKDMARTEIVYLGLAIVAAALWRRFTARSVENKEEATLRSTLLDFVFYALIGVMVASSVQIAGVLVVFTWLVMPAVVAWTWCRSWLGAVLVALPLSCAGSWVGLYVSLKANNEQGWETGASIVVVFGLLVLANYVVRLFFKAPATDPA